GLGALLRVVQTGERADLVIAQLRVVEQHARHEQRPRAPHTPRPAGDGHDARAELAVELEKLASGAAGHGREDSAALSRRAVRVTLSSLLRGRFAVGLGLG